MKNLNFETLAKRELSERELNSLSGGNVCGCGCAGSSSNYDNGEDGPICEYRAVSLIK